MKNFEKLVNEIMAEYEKGGEPILREDAEDIAKMEIKAKSNRHYETSTAKKKRKPRERKIDEDKANLIGEVLEMLRNCNIEIINVKTETEIKFNYNKNDYTFKLIRHRPQK